MLLNVLCDISQYSNFDPLYMVLSAATLKKYISYTEIHTILWACVLKLLDPEKFRKKRKKKKEERRGRMKKNELVYTVTIKWYSTSYFFIVSGVCSHVVVLNISH